jgi:hypothetical protein
MRPIAVRTCAALAFVAMTTAACDVLTLTGDDPNRVSLFGSSTPMYRPPGPQSAPSQGPVQGPDTGPIASGPALLETPRNELQLPYPSQQQVLQQQQMQLNQGIRQQTTNRDALGQQLQQGVLRDQLDAQRLQQQIDRDRARFQ